MQPFTHDLVSVAGCHPRKAAFRTEFWSSRRGRRTIAGVALIRVLSALIYSSSTTVAPAQGAEVIALERAQFVADGAPPRAVLLPHTWARGGLGNTGRALYRFEFHLARTPGQPWACRHRACRRATWCA